MLDRERSAISWIDFLWLVFLGGLALLPPLSEIHKQLIILAIVVVQLFEGGLIAPLPKRGPVYIVAMKILLATLLLDHTGDMGINSNYYPIFFLPVVSAAVYFGPIGTLAWTTVASLAYLSLLIEAVQEYALGRAGINLLTIRVLFFFIAAILVNRFVMENRRQVERLETLSKQLEETNRELRRAEAEARRAERLAALGQLSAGLAHEIRNPLGVIKGSAEMLSRKVAESQPLVAELSGYILSEVNRLNALVVRVLGFARPSKLEMRPESISEIVDSALQSTLASFPNANVKVERQYPPGLPEIQADRQLCEQVFVNRITNAFQAMQEGHAGSPNGIQDGISDAAALTNPTQTSDKILRLSIAPEISSGEPGVCVTVQDSG